MKGLSLLRFVDQIEDVAGVAAEPIEAGDHQLIAGPEELQHGCQLRPTIAAAT